MLMRSAAADARDRPVENLAVNPSFERAVAGSTIVRRNLGTQPRGSGTSWTSVGGNTGTSTPPRPIDGVSTARSVVSTGGSELYVASTIAGQNLVTPGRNVSLSMGYVATGVDQVRLRYAFLDAGGAVVGLGVRFSGLFPGSSGRAHIADVPVPAGAVRASIAIYAVGYATGATLWASAVLIEERPAVLPYFDGLSANTRGIAYSTEADGTSVARAVVVEVRRNRAIRPNADAFWTGAAGTGGAVSDTFENGLRKTTWTTAPSGGAGSRISAGDAVNVTPGEVIAVSADAAASEGTPRVGLLVDWLRADGSYVSLSVSPDVVASTSTGAPSRVGFAVTVPNNTEIARAKVYVRFISTVPAAGMWLAGGRLLIEGAPAVLPYLDGATTPDADLAPAWTGAENASPSVLYGIAVASTPSANCARYIALRNGGPALALYPTGTSRDTFAEQGGGTGGFALGMRPGQTYTAIARISYDFAPPSGQVPGLRLFYRTPTTGYVPVTAVASVNAGTHEVRLTVRLPDDATEAFIRFQHAGALGSLPVYFTRFALIEGVYTGPYLDGDMPGCIWRGSPHASPSVGYATAA